MALGHVQWGHQLMLTMVIGAAFCCVPLAVLFERFAPARRLPQQWAANDNLRLHERPCTAWA